MADPVYLDDLEDVSVPDPADGDVLYWDEAASLWKCKAPPLPTNILTRQVCYSSDDTSVWWIGAAWQLHLSPDWLQVGYASTGYERMGGGARFSNIYVPKDANIKHAYLKQIAFCNDNLPDVKSRLHGEKNATPATFSNYANYNARTRTDAVINWDDIPAWTEGELYTSPDIKSLIQEIVNLPAWASGNPLVIFWDDHDNRSPNINNTRRVSRDWDHPSRTPPMLYVEWEA